MPDVGTATVKVVAELDVERVAAALRAVAPAMRGIASVFEAGADAAQRAAVALEDLEREVSA